MIRLRRKNWLPWERRTLSGLPGLHLSELRFWERQVEMDRRKFYLELGQRLEAEGTARIATGIRGERTGRKRFLTAAEEPDRDEFAEKLAGRQRVVVCGGGHVSLALEQVLKTLPCI